MTAAVMFSTPNHKMVAGHHYMGDFTPSRLNDSLLQKMIYSTPNFEPSTPITPSSVAHTTSVSKYVNMGTIGEGSYGLVLKCKERQTGRIVAIKKFIESEEDKSVRKIAMREIHLLKQLRHENLVNLLEVFRRKSRLYLVFEFVEKSLLDHLELSPNGLERGQCRRILYQVIRALEFCHIHNIIHRDVKPENILISKHGVVKLCDFGFARTLAKPGEIYTEYVSTRWYRAPELLVGDARYGRAVDIWALGCLSAEMMTGQPLFPGDSDIDQLFSIVKCFGGLCTRHEDRLYSNPMFRFEISQIEVTEPLKCRIRGCSSREFQFVASCLELDPQDRPTCSVLMRHPLFTCDGFTSWFPEELEEMLRRDADEHKLPIEAPKPKRLLPDLKKCILLNSSTPIKGSSAHPVNLFAQSTNHQQPNSYNDCFQDKAATTHRNLEKAFGNCVANDYHDDGDDDDGKSPHNDSGHDDDERFNFDLRPQDTYDLQLPDSSAISDLDLSFSHLGIREGVELEGEESPRKLMNINEDDDYDDYDDYEEAVNVPSNSIYNYAHDDDVYGNSKQHPVSVQPVNHNNDYNKNNDFNNNNNKNNYNNNNNNNRKQQNSSKSKSLSSASSSSSAMTSLPSSSSSSASSKSSASTSGVSSPSSSSSSTSSLFRNLNNNNHQHQQQLKNNYHNNKNNYSPINNNNYNNSNYYYYNRHKSGANNSTNNVQSHKGPYDANPKSQNQKFPQHSTSKNYKSQQQDQTRTQNKPLQPLQQKNNIIQQQQKNNNQQYNQHQQQKNNNQQHNQQHKQQQQQQYHYKQAENESPKPVQRSTQQQYKQQQQQQKFQNPQKQQNFQSKPAKKKSNFDAGKPSQKQTAPKFSTNQTKIGFKHS